MSENLATGRVVRETPAATTSGALAACFQELQRLGQPFGKRRLGGGGKFARGLVLGAAPPRSGGVGRGCAAEGPEADPAGASRYPGRTRRSGSPDLSGDGL